MNSMHTDSPRNKTHRHERVNFPALRDAWLAEMWPTVREYRAGGDDTPQAAQARHEGLGTFFGDEPTHDGAA